MSEVWKPCYAERKPFSACLACLISTYFTEHSFPGGSMTLFGDPTSESRLSHSWWSSPDNWMSEHIFRCHCASVWQLQWHHNGVLVLLSFHPKSTSQRTGRSTNSAANIGHNDTFTWKHSGRRCFTKWGFVKTCFFFFLSFLFNDAFNEPLTWLQTGWPVICPCLPLNFYDVQQKPQTDLWKSVRSPVLLPFLKHHRPPPSQIRTQPGWIHFLLLAQWWNMDLGGFRVHLMTDPAHSFSDKCQSTFLSLPLSVFVRFSIQDWSTLAQTRKITSWG